MQVDKSLKLLKKINTVFHSILENSESVSALEKQLLKSYVVQFYDSILEEKTESAKVSPTPIKIEQKPAPVERPEPPAQAAPVVVAPEEVVVSSKDSEPSTLPSSSPADEQPIEAVEASEEVGSHQNGETSYFLQDAFDNIEQEIANGHIGLKLDRDLKKALGLNDKLRYANDLFGGNQSQLLDTLEKLNEEQDSAVIKAHLDDLAKEHQWDAEDEERSVRSFLQLIFSKKSIS